MRKPRRPWGNCINITSEAILEDASNIVEAISRQFSIPRKSDRFIDYEKSTKNENRDQSYYRDYYLGEKWRELLTPEAQSLINDRVDRELMSRFGYELIE